MKKVIVGVSGGVDSSVCLHLLKEEGYEVEGLFMRNWDSTINNDILGNPDINNNICPQEQDYNDALSVCKKLGIKLHRVDFIKEYWDYVFTYFLDELKKGRTPNPDIMCNKFIKFDLFIKHAKKLGADKVATGHYAILKDNKLYKAVDKNKDQTYFLSQVEKKHFKDVLFPLGKYTKKEVREIANNLDLKVSDKKDSTGICFIGERNFQKFLKNYLPINKGKIINIETNKELGEHLGLMNYTIGQSRGLDIGGTKEKLYVVGKNLNKNILYVAMGSSNTYLYSDAALVKNFNHLVDKNIKECTCKFRYRQKDIDVRVEYIDDNTIKVYYNNVKAVTPGQACVLYKNDLCLGGGIIDKVYENNEIIEFL